MVSVLLSSLHPTAQRIDGSGGDNGKDVQIPREDGLFDIYELKSFTGRLSTDKGRRKQVERSLATAAKLNPASWTLVVPIDPTPGEETWFDGLRSSYSFPLTWRGETWLNTQMSQNPQIERYFLHQTADEVVQLLSQFRDEQDALIDGVPQAVERLKRLGAQLNDLSPHYKVDLGLVDGSPRFTLKTRYRGAEIDRPIKIHATLVFPKTSVGEEARRRWEDAINFGDPVEVPGEFVTEVDIDAPAGMAETLENATMTMGPAEGSEAFLLDSQLRISSPDGHLLSSLPVQFTRRRSGARGGTFEGQDATNSISISLRFDLVDKTVEVTFGVYPAPGHMPGALLPALRLARHIAAPNLLMITAPHGPLTDPVPLPDDPIITAAMVDLLEDLDRVQAATSTAFTVPDEFSPADVAAIRLAAKLVAGEAVPLAEREFTVTLHAGSSRDQLAARNDLEPSRFAFHWPDRLIVIADTTVHLGPVTIYIPAGRIREQADLLSGIADEDDLHATVAVEPGQHATLRRGRVAAIEPAADVQRSTSDG